MKVQDAIQAYKKAVEHGVEEATDVARSFDNETSKAVYDALKTCPFYSHKLVRTLWFDYKRQEFKF